MNTGIVKWFDQGKRYGFITPDDGGEDVFVHVSSVSKLGTTMLDEGQKIQYGLGDNNGRSCAVDLKLL